MRKPLTGNKLCQEIFAFNWMSTDFDLMKFRKWLDLFRLNIADIHQTQFFDTIEKPKVKFLRDATEGLGSPGNKLLPWSGQ